MTKSDFEKVAELWIVSWEFSVIYLRTAIPQTKWLLTSFFLVCKGLFSFVYSATPKILRIIYLPYLSHWKLCCLLLFLEN